MQGIEIAQGKPEGPWENAYILSSVLGFGAMKVVTLAVVLVGATAHAQEDDVTFLVMGKTTNHRQSAAGSMTLLNYHFFAEIFVKPGGSVTNAELHFPGGTSQAFEDLGFVQEVHGGRYQVESELDRLYPNGGYTFRFDTPSGSATRTLAIRGTGGGQSRIPEAARITLRQGDSDVSPKAVDPAEDLEVRWSPFVTGEADPNRIVDDLVFAVMGDCHGEKTVHSGRPFEGTPYLSYTTRRYVIPAEKLSPGEPHQLFVEHAKVDTSFDNGVVGMVTYASTTFLDFQTTGMATGEPCPASMPKMDQGQTDRN